jgi:hypothetical protein
MPGGIRNTYNQTRAAGNGFTRGWCMRHPDHPFSNSMDSKMRYTTEGTHLQMTKDHDSVGWTGNRVVKGFPASKFATIPMNHMDHPRFVRAMVDMNKNYEMKPSPYSIVHAGITEEFDSFDARKRGGIVFYPPGYKKFNRNKTFSFKHMHDGIQKDGRDKTDKEWNKRSY